jgi:hypothetical protein
MTEPAGRPKIAVFAGPTATILNSHPLVTSNKARDKYGLPPLLEATGRRPRFDALRAQRLAQPVTVYVEQFSAHPLEADAAELYGPPDGYIAASGAFHAQRQSPADVPVYEVVLHPDDGLYLLPYMARQADGTPWDGAGADGFAPAERFRQTFYPDAARVFEEVDRVGLDERGRAGLLSEIADFEFFRAAPSAGYRRGLTRGSRTDEGEGDIAPESLGEDYFPYLPWHLRHDPPARSLALLTNAVKHELDTGSYDGLIWIEGSPFVEETAYWLNLLIDTTRPMVGTAAQRPHAALGSDGDRNLLDAARYIRSGIWSDGRGDDAVGFVVIQEEQIFTAREVQKADARPGGYVATGGHGGIIGSTGHPEPASVAFRPTKRHTAGSEVNLRRLPTEVLGTRSKGGAITTVLVRVKDDRGDLVPSAIPKVTVVKHARYLNDDASLDPTGEVETLSRIERNLRDFPLAGFVGEGAAPYGNLSKVVEAALVRAVFSGMPVVLAGRGNPGGPVPPRPGSLFITGSDLTSTKARLLLMACLLRFGSLPPAADPAAPTAAELAAARDAIARYQAVFDTH